MPLLEANSFLFVVALDHMGRKYVHLGVISRASHLPLHTCIVETLPITIFINHIHSHIYDKWASKL